MLPTEQAQALEVLSEKSNFAVVRMARRNFPGPVIQGDTLNSLYRDVRDLERQLRTTLGATHDLTSDAAAIADALQERLWLYEQDLERAGYAQLPYATSVGRPDDGSEGQPVV